MCTIACDSDAYVSEGDILPVLFANKNSGESIKLKSQKWVTIYSLG